MQKKILAAFSNPEFYPHKTGDIRRTQTHTAWVFLTGERAYKIKKPVNFGFLDFSTLERRKEFCQKEVELNRELSDLYLGVESVTLDSSGNPRLGGEGKPVEYVVVMKELPQDSLMSALLRQHKVSHGLIHSLAREIARFHRDARTSPQITREGSLEAVRFNWEENFVQTEGVRDVTISCETFDLIKQRVEDFITKREEDFRKRERDGHIRYCHGDLHSGNIFVHEGKIEIFDRIEFNLRFACSDTAADLAFMTMDLDFHDRRELSDFLLDTYLDESGDYELLKFHDFFRCYRAYVRGKVIGFQLAQNPPNPEEVAERARSYFELARLYAASMDSAPKLIVFYGLPGTGKSYMAARTRDWTNAVHIRSDVLRRVLAGVSLDEHHYAAFGAELYSPDISEKVYEALARKVKLYLSEGQSLIVDATCHRAADRLRLKQAAEETGVSTYFIRCEASDEKIKTWIAERKTRDMHSDATWEIYQTMKERFEPEGQMPHFTLVTGREPEVMDSDIRRIIQD